MLTILPTRVGAAALLRAGVVLACSALAMPLAAASFDCGKAATAVEKAICANPRLSRLDDELAASYREAMTVTVDPRGLKSSQGTWLREVRDACEAEFDCLEQAMLARLETMRDGVEWGVKLFGSETPPASIFGRYSETEPVCMYGRDGEIACEGEGESYIDLAPGEGNRVRVVSELIFFNAHFCTFDSVGEWAGDELRVPSELEEVGCVLVLRFRDGKVVTDDPGGRCKWYCGARGGFHGIELPKLGPDEAEAKRKASVAR